MVVCKYFLQGTCAFGSMCRNEHQVNDSYNPYQTTGASVLRNSNFGTPQISQSKMPTQEKSSVDTGMLIKSVVTDMTQAEKGGQWLFSCYAPYKEKPAFPGFEDQSFEELRLGYYEAAKSGSVEPYKQQVQGMVQQVITKVKSLQNPSPEVVNMLVNIYNTPPSPQAGIYSGNSQPNTASNFTFKSGGISQQSTASIFGQANQNIFGNSLQPSVFNAATSNVFGGNNQSSQSLFSNQQPAASSNIFAQANSNLGAQSNSIFGGQQPSGSIFSSNPQPINATTAPVNTGSIFNNALQQTSGSIFSSASQQTGANIFASQNQQNNVFQPVSQAPNLFATQSSATKSPLMPTPVVNTPLLPTPSIFGNQMLQPQNNQFSQLQQNQMPQSTVFNQAATFTNSNSVVGPPPKLEMQPAFGTNNMFANAQKSNTQNAAPINFDQSIYSKLEDLTEAEIKWFQSDDLDITNIPEKPPTYEMCFKI